MHLLKKTFASLMCAAIATLMLVAGPVHAGLTVPTRVVFDGSRKEKTIELTNVGDQPSLVQAWLDVGDPDADPATINVPFVITPALFRVEPDSSQVLRVINAALGKPLPKDRETRLFLNLLDVPPKLATDAEQSKLSLAVHYRMPFIYRPAALQDVANPHPSVHAATQAQFSLNQSADGWTLRVANNSAYSLSFRSITTGPSGSEYATAGGEVLPFSESSFPMSESVPGPSAEGWVVRYGVVDDAGYAVPGEGRLR
ncbi:fimbria/pilus periplasmic chaperone [Lysobacter sp. LF1]|uniref:Fimbria/pilus periplasmic chaperone n=1 Tax=Lysobacter stagni TaxID=3045172 RepID=A0ABT6XIH3_9GAMM|nr:fimbria/pilus periplasmic chaperone [Lysobacter sp. LF1]MDI9239888.1 fimbria/pilus periplasmic chaperone [Lysobacter sp. LF1]